MLDLGQQLLSIMITSQVIGQVKELLIPFVIGKVKKFTDISSAKRAQESASASTQVRRCMSGRRSRWSTHRRKRCTRTYHTREIMPSPPPPPSFPFSVAVG